MLSAWLSAYGQEGSSRDSIVDLRSVYGTMTGAFVGLDTKTGTTYHFNPQLCSTRLTPASTFKIPNSLVGLETGVIPDEHYVIKWDGVRRWSNDWNRDHDLASAIKYSVVPYYQELARRVGRERMQHWVDTLNYGNKDISGGIDHFWLGSSLRISPEEQIDFLNRLRTSRLPCTQRSMDIVRRIIIQDSGSGWRLHAKTGMAEMDSTSAVGWYVGWVERPEGDFVFASCIVTHDAEHEGEMIFEKKKELAVNALRSLGMMK